MPGIHKDSTMAFRPNAWQKAMIKQRAALSGLNKKDFIARSCIYSNIVVVGKRENIQCIIDAIQEMQVVMREIAGQIQSGNFLLSDDGYQQLKADYLSLAITVVDILDGAAYLFEREPPSKHRNWKAELELEQYRHVLEVEQQKENMVTAEESDEEKCPKYGCNRGKNDYNKSEITLDIYAEDSEGKVYGIEVQRADAGQFYRMVYPGKVVRGYHCPPVQQPYWNTIYLDDFPDEELLNMIDQAYETVFHSFSKKVQCQILEEVQEKFKEAGQ